MECNPAAPFFAAFFAFFFGAFLGWFWEAATRFEEFMEGRNEQE